MFSATVSDGTRRASWNDRPSPSQARLSARQLVMSCPSRRMRPRSGMRKPEMRSKIVVLPAPFGPMRPEDLAVAQRERRVVDGADAAEALGELGDLEDDRTLGEVVERCASRPRTAWSRPDVGLARAFEEHRADDVVALEQLGGETFEPDLALLQEVRPLGHGEGDVDRLLDEDDRGAVVAGSGARCRAAARRWSAPGRATARRSSAASAWR